MAIGVPKATVKCLILQTAQRAAKSPICNFCGMPWTKKDWAGWTGWGVGDGGRRQLFQILLSTSCCRNIKPFKKVNMENVINKVDSVLDSLFKSSVVNPPLVQWKWNRTKYQTDECILKHSMRDLGLQTSPCRQWLHPSRTFHRFSQCTRAQEMEGKKLGHCVKKDVDHCRDSCQSRGGQRQMPVRQAIPFGHWKCPLWPFKTRLQWKQMYSLKQKS